MFSVHTNMAFLFAYRHFGLHQNTLVKSLRRLSSGYRINSAADDAAGLAVSEKMRAQIRDMRMAFQNTQQVLSLLQTADGALSESTSILHRLKELSVQAANGTMTSDDRELLNIEYQALLDEIDRISNSTHYNGIKILDGTVGGKKGQDGLDSMSFGAVISADNSYNGSGKITVNKKADGQVFLSFQTGDETVTATHSGTGDVEFALKDGTKIMLTGLDASALREGSISGIKFSDGAPDITGTRTATCADSKLVFQIGANNGANQRLGTYIHDMSSASLGLDTGDSLRNTNILSRENAGKAISIIDASLGQVNKQRAYISANVSRLEYTISNLENQIINLEGSESKIRDADMATEMMNFIKASILSQCAQMVMAHSMQSQRNILMLLHTM